MTTCSVPRPRCPNHPHTSSNASGLCPNCVRSLAVTPESRERRRLINNAERIVRYQLMPVEKRRALNARGAAQARRRRASGGVS